APLPAPMLAHCPQLFERHLVGMVWERWRGLFEPTLTHRFRDAGNAHLAVLYFATLLGQGSPHRAVVNVDNLAAFVGVGPGWDVAASLGRVRPDALCLCVNDEVEDA